MTQKNWFSELPTLETKRLILRKLRITDASHIFAFTSRRETTEHLTWEPHASIDATLAFLATMEKKYAAGENGQWGICHKADSRIIGICGFIVWIPGHAKAEVAHVLSPDYWRKGLITEAFSEVLRFGFEQMGLNRVEAKIIKGNEASAKQLMKTGLSLEGTLREYALIRGRYVDYEVYSILRREYMQRRGGA